MSELQISLIAFGAVLVAAVWGFNVWQERQHRRRAESLLPAQEVQSADVLMAGREKSFAEGGRSEPGFDAPVIPQEPTFADPVEQPAASLAATESELPPVAAVTPRVVPIPAEWADGSADCLMRIEFPDPVSAAAVWAEQSDWSARIDKPMQWLWLDGQEGRWRTLLPEDSHPVLQVAAALQLADRKGPVGDKTLADFVAGMHQLAQRYAGLVELPDQPAVLQRARDLDGFCAGVDLQLSLFVLPRQGSLTEMVGSKLPPEIEAAGLRLEGERFVAFDAAEAEVFALSCQAATAFSLSQLDTARLTALAFVLDVPRVASGPAGFDRMVACARRCAEVLGGQVVDAQKKPLAEATVNAIRQRIGELQAQMAARAIPAGGVRALRLFA